jgi:hypothetical protein
VGGRRRKHHIQIRVLGGGIAVTRDGTNVHLGPNHKAILHALVIGKDPVPRVHLDEALPYNPKRTSARQAVRNALSQLHNGSKLDLKISENDKTASLSLEDGRVWIDLWAFYDHVDAGEYGKARALIPGAAEPKPLEEDVRLSKFWQEAFNRFAEKKREVLRAVKATTGREQMMRDARDQLLKRSLIPGIGREVPIASVREAIEPIGFPWQEVRPEGKLKRDPLPAELAEILSGSSGSSPERLLVIGGGGAGKTLAAISTFLLLTDGLSDPETTEEARLVFFVDGQTATYGGGSEPTPASDDWFEQRLLDLEADDGGRPILVMSHADSFFSAAKGKLSEILNWRIFQECDVLLCFSETFYEDEFKFTGYGDRAFRLERWAAKDQKAFASALFARKTWQRFVTWQKADESGTRERLCKVPLHLSFVLPVVEDQADALESISTRWHLFDQLARARLDAAHLGDRKEQLLGELAAIAHHFYVADRPDDEAIAFNRKDLESFLRARDKKRDKKDLEERLAIVIHHTLIEDPPHGRVDFHFEDPAWGWFFAALHLGELLKSDQPAEPVLKAFAKPFSEPVMELCEEILADEFSRHEEQIMCSLQGAREDKTTAKAMTAAKCKTAEGQVARLLKTVEALVPA